MQRPRSVDASQRLGAGFASIIMDRILHSDELREQIESRGFGFFNVDGSRGGHEIAKEITRAAAHGEMSQNATRFGRAIFVKV